MSLRSIVNRMRAQLSLREMVEKATEAALVILSESVNGTKVDPERLKKRYSICQECPNLKLLDSGEFYCGYCKCPLSSDRKILNRAMYSTVSCPDPKGDRWKKGGC